MVGAIVHQLTRTLTEEQVKEYLAGNLCRCSGYEGQLRGIMSFLAWKKQKEGVQ